MVGDYFSGEASIAYGFGQPLSSKKILPSLLFPSFLSRCFSRSKTPFSVVLSIAVVPRFGGRTLVNTSESNDLLCRVSCMCVCVRLGHFENCRETFEILDKPDQNLCTVPTPYIRNVQVQPHQFNTRGIYKQSNRSIFC